jgi:hypothetical protein
MRAICMPAREAWNKLAAQPHTPNGIPATTSKLFTQTPVSLAGLTSVSPDGSSSSRDVVVSGLEAAHGAYPGITVEIRRFKFIATSAELGVARYEEWQFHPARTSARLSLVVMRRDADARHGWRWLALHETWLPGAALGSVQS